jgi:O-methyltransferase involved in polyketide biosynthesis
MDADKVHVPEERKSYLSTIYGKALDARAEHPILGDTFADDATRRIDFDFHKLAVGGDAAITLPFRAKFFDNWTREFLGAHPDSNVLHLGCGLDTGLPDRPSADRPVVRRRPPRSHRTAQTSVS